MKNYLSPIKTKLFLAAIVVLLAASAAFSQTPTPWSQNTSPLPPPTGFINDYAGVIDPSTKQALETKLKNFRDTTEKHVELSVAIVKTTGDRAIFDYSLAVYRGWGIGSKADDNPGALLLVAIDDRKYFTQVSKDLEDELPDGVVGSLQRQYLVPEFKKGNYAKGISDTLDAYIETIRNKGNPPTAAPTKPVKDTGGTSGFSFGGIVCCAVILLVVLLIIFGRSKGGPTSGDRSRWGGGGFGGGGGSSGGDIASAVIGGIIGSALSGGSSSSSSSDWGGSSGGGSDWGGFGGGGDAGGGGAGGDW